LAVRNSLFSRFGAALAAAVAAACLAAGAQAAPAPLRGFTASTAPAPVAHYPEGPQLLAHGLLVAEMPLDRVAKLEHGRLEPVFEQKGCGPTSVKHIPGGGFWVLCHLGHRVLRLDEHYRLVATVDRSSDGAHITWPNDASVDPDGNLYLSSSGIFAPDAPAQGRVIYIAVANNEAKVLAGDIHYANGVLVEPKEGRLLVSEHLEHRVLAFPLRASGVIGERTVLFDFKDAPAVAAPYELHGADGMARFANGDVGVADYGNGRIIVFSADGKYLEQIPLEFRFVTNFAIRPDQSAIYVTMTRDNSSAELDGVVREFTIQSKDQHRAQR
jgi:sugar lactone lactonase YvrE